MKIAIIFPKGSEALFNKNSKRTFGGASVQMYNIAKELSRYKDKQVDTLSFILDYPIINFKDENYFNLIKTYKENDPFFLKFFKLHNKIVKTKPDIIFQHGLTEESCFLAKYCNIKGIKYIFMFAHDVEVEGLSQSKRTKIKFFKTLLGNSFKIITQNKFQKEYLKKNFHISSKEIKNGFYIPKRTQASKRDSILWVARCDRWKKPELFFDLAKRFKSNQFVMVCPRSSDSVFFNKIKEEANSISNLNFIEFASRDEINELFKKAKLFINTSDSEGFPQTFIEATMNGVPILSLNSNPNNFITENNCGICANGIFDQLEKEAKTILNNENLYKKLSENAANYAKDNHDIKKNVKKILKILK